MSQQDIVRNKLFAGAAMKTAIKGLLSKCPECLAGSHGKGHRHSKLRHAMESWCNGVNPREWKS